MHGHIKMLRALGSALESEQDHVTLAFPSGASAVKTMLSHLSQACKCAAEDLEKQELELLERIASTER